MKAVQAWQAAYDQLAINLPKAIFDRWVGDAHLAAYEDGTFVIGAPNEYTRLWLEERLSSTVIQLLTGLMNQSVAVRFIVSQSDRDDEDITNDDQAAPQLGEEQKQLKIQLAHASLRDEFVHPNRVIVMPGYFQRWLPYLGPTLAWIVVAFRQAMFMTTHREARAEVDFEVSPASLARWAGIDRTTLWRRLDDRMLGWFLKRTSCYRNTFRFMASMPLTPGDAQSLYDWLIAAGVHADPVAALEKALVVESGCIFLSPPAPPTQELLSIKPEPQSIQDIVLQACGRMDKKATLAKVMQLADQLAARLMPTSDSIHITHYFLLHHLPELGAAPAWLVTLLRDRCYSDKDNPRDSVWIRGGYAQIAQMLGLRRPKTISEWLPPVFENKAIPRPPHVEEMEQKSAYEYRAELRAERRIVLQQFIQRTKYLANASATSWNFKVALIEPLSPDDQATYDWIIDLVGTYLETSDRSAIDTILSASSADGILEALVQPGRDANATRSGALATGVDEHEAHMQRGEARVQPGSGAHATPTGAVATGERRACNTQRRDCNALNSLNLLFKLLKQLGLNSANPAETTLEVETESQPSEPAGSVVVDPSWDLSVLFSRNPSVKTEVQKMLLAQNASAQVFISWLIYTASANGKGITKPAQFAASKLLGNPQAGAGSVYDRLAALPPKNLYELIDGALCGFRQSATVPSEARADWQAVMANAYAERIVALKGQLFE